MIVNGKTVTSNQYYGGLNRRFDRRVRLLSKLGYKYTRTQFGGMFVIDRHSYIISIQACLVMSGHNRDFLVAVRFSCKLRKEENYAVNR
jgi:hypothetical protein